MGANEEALQLHAVYKAVFFTTNHVRIRISTASHVRIRISTASHVHCVSERPMKSKAWFV